MTYIDAHDFIQDWQNKGYKPIKNLYGYICVHFKDGKQWIYDILRKDLWEDFALCQNEYKVSFTKEIAKGDLEICVKSARGGSKNNKIRTIVCHEDDVTWHTKKVTRQVACCLFNATKDHMRSMFGMSLDEDDKSWYEKYAEKINEHGCQQAWTMTVVQQLIEPYGLGIAEVRVPPNAMRYDEHTTFMQALGCNPAFLADGKTTDEEWAASVGLTGEAKDMALKSFRFKCSHDKNGPAIVLKMFGTTTAINTHNGAASYIGPRGNTQSIFYIRLGRLSDIKYNQSLVLDPYKSIDDTLVSEPIWTTLRGKSGKTLTQLVTELKPKPVYNHVYTGSSSRSNYSRGVGSSDKNCPTCRVYLISSEVGRHIQEDGTYKYSCVKCKSALSVEFVSRAFPHLTYGNSHSSTTPNTLSTKPDFSCQHCHTKINYYNVKKVYTSGKEEYRCVQCNNELPTAEARDTYNDYPSRTYMV